MHIKVGDKRFYKAALVVITILSFNSFPTVFAMGTAEANTPQVSEEALRLHEEEVARTQALSDKIAAPDEDAIITGEESELDDSTQTMDVTLDEVQE